jgi:hypothetical protein
MALNRTCRDRNPPQCSNYDRLLAAKEKGLRGQAFFLVNVSRLPRGAGFHWVEIQSGRKSVPVTPSRKKRVMKVIFLAPISALFRASHFVNEKFTLPQLGILRRVIAAHM